MPALWPIILGLLKTQAHALPLADLGDIRQCVRVQNAGFCPPDREDGEYELQYDDSVHAS